MKYIYLILILLGCSSISEYRIRKNVQKGRTAEWLCALSFLWAHNARSRAVTRFRDDHLVCDDVEAD